MVSVVWWEGAMRVGEGGEGGGNWAPQARFRAQYPRFRPKCKPSAFDSYGKFRERGENAAARRRLKVGLVMLPGRWTVVQP